MTHVHRRPATRVLSPMVAALAAVLVAALTWGGPSAAQTLSDITKSIRKAPATVLEPVAAATDLKRRGAVAESAAQIVPTTEAGVLYHVAVPATNDRLITQDLVKRFAQRSLPPAVIPPGVLRQQAAGGGAELVLKPVFRATKLMWDPAAQVFTGYIQVGVIELPPSTVQRGLSAPVHFQVLETGVAEPQSLEVKATVPPYLGIKVSTRSPGAALVVRVASELDTAGTEVTLPVAPTLNITASSTAIDGWGLEQTDLHLTLLGVENPKGAIVNLQTGGSGGYLVSSSVALDEHGRGATSIRSRALGNIRVTGQVDGEALASTDVEARFPGLTLAAAILGALVGGLIRLLMSHDRSRTGGRAAVLLATSVLVGILVFALYAVGVNVVLATLPVGVGAVAVLVVAALGAYGGTALLPKPPTGR